MTSSKKDRLFLDKPSYPGGKVALAKFLRESLKYPQKALKEGIEGTVFLEFKVETNGSVTEARVVKGIGGGCDEEALRVVRLMKFLPATNRGAKVSTRRKLPIRFKLPPKKKSSAAIKYKYVSSSSPKSDEKGKKSYTYTINL